MTTVTSQLRFRRGMTLAARDKLREAIREEELAKAIRRAEAMYLTQTCRQAMALTGSEDAGYVRDLHLQCRGEIPGGVGCLCRCHDVIGEGVVTGSASFPELPA